MLNLILAILFALLPACPVEDATYCAWDASTQGNHIGHSFIAFGEDVRIYLP